MLMENTPLQPECIVTAEQIHQITPLEQSLINEFEVEASEKRGFIGHTKHFFGRAGGVVTTLGSEIKEEVSEADTVSAKAAPIGVAALAAAGQAWDRGRGTEILGIPLAIELYEQHQNAVVGAAAFALMTYGVQGSVGAAWGMATKKFKKTADNFNDSFPNYVNTLAEENAGYLKTLWRHSITGLGTGNTIFVGAEVLNNQNISTKGVLKISEKTARRLAVSTGLIGYGVLTAAEKHYERSIGIPGVFDESVPQLVELAKKPSTWIIFGVGMELVPRLAGYTINSTISKLSKLFNGDRNKEK